MFVTWGPDRTLIYNDGYAEILGCKHPDALGRPLFEVWSEIRGDLQPLVSQADAGQSVHLDDITLILERHGSPEEAHFAFSYTPVRDASGRVAGIFCPCTETTGQVRAERGSVAERERLTQLFDQAPGFMAMLRGPEHVFELVNAAYLQLIGHRDVIGKPVRDALPEIEGQGFFELLDRVYASGEAFTGTSLKVGLQRSPGAPVEERFVDLVYQPVTDAGGCLIGIFAEGSDVTERVRAEEALREREERLRLVVEGAKDHAILTTDEAGLITTWSAGAAAIFGWSPEEAIGEEAGIIFTPEDRANGADRQEMDTAALEGSALDERWHIRKDGSRVFMSGTMRPLHDGQGRARGFIKVAQDETERRRAVDALRTLNDTLEQQVAERTRERDRMWRLSTDVMLVARFDATIEAFNPAWTSLLGWAQEEVLGRSFMDFVHPDDVAATRAEAGRLAEGLTTLRFENRYRCKDGSYRWLSWIAVPDEDLIHAVGRDVTAEKQAADALRETEEALRQAQKMEAVGQLTGGIAHDFNNLLAGIVGSLDLMQTRIAQGRTENVERYAKAAMSSAQRAAALTHRLLAFSRRQPLDPKPANANQLVTSIEDMLRRTIGPMHALEIVTAGGLWTTLCDPNQLESAILNLVINARDAMPEGGKLTIETCNAHLDDTYTAKLHELSPGQYVCICVTDTGTGMPPEVVARAFEPFFTTKPLGQGTGLGLSMVYGFAKQSEGHLKIYSEEGTGTTIKIYLPRHRGVAVEEEHSSSSTEPPRAETGETVLVVEDEPVVRDLIVEVLGDLGYRALEAPDGPSGLRMLQSRERIDLVVTDVGLPGLNGRQLADQARVTRPGLKVLFITGYAENATLAGGFLEPGMEMITKPFAVEALATKVSAMLGRARPGVVI
jgi:PAS domain S-box-containing protein